MASEKSSTSLNSVPKDVAKFLGGYLGNSLFAFSSINKKFRGFFEQERTRGVGTVKIMVKNVLGMSFLLTFEGKLYGCGSNSSNLLNPGKGFKDSRQWTALGSPDKKIDEVVCGKHHDNIFVRCEEAWYGIGPDYANAEVRDEGSQSSIEYPIMDFKPLWGLDNKKVLKVTHCAGRFYIFCDDQNWYACGNNWWGKLNANSGADIIKEWIKINPSTKRVLNIIPTENTTFAQSEEEWYSCGMNEHGQLGQGIFSLRESWGKIGLPGKTILDLKANNENTLIYCSDGCWYGCGENSYGQLGIGNREAQSSWVRLGPAGKEIKGVWLCRGRIFISCNEGLYMSGYNHRGWFHRKSEGDILNWEYIGFENKTIFNILGHSAETYIHCSDGWYAKGKNKHGQFGRKGKAYEWIKLKCEGKNVQQVVPANRYVFACTQDAWYMAGDNSNGQSGRNEWKENYSSWVKIISHDQKMEDVLREIAHRKIPPPVEVRIKRFREALQKLYDRDIVKKISDESSHCFDRILADNAAVCIGYDVNNPRLLETVYLFIFNKPDRTVRLNHQDEFIEKIGQLLECEHEGGIQLKIINSPETAGEFLYEAISPENYDPLVSFLKNFESVLDEKLLITSAEQLSVASSETKRLKVNF